ncbi:MAG: redoxin domain-containing protein [Planctomycetota bacterium]
MSKIFRSAPMTMLLPFAALVPLFGQEPSPAAHSRENVPATVRVDVHGMRVQDLAGEVVRLGVDGGLTPIAFVFLDPGCPIARRYAPGLGALAERAAKRGVGFHAVVSDPAVTPDEVRAFVEEYGLEAHVLFDGSGELASRLAPTTVPEAFVVAADGGLAYRGRIDDRFASVGRPRARVTSHDLRDAIDAAGPTASGAPVVTEPVGCVFEARSDESSDESSEHPSESPSGAAVTYWRDVAPILSANCVECHRAGSVGPFQLETHAQAKRRARMIARVCEERLMPPWRAEEGFGHFRDARALSDRQIRTLRAWADADAPEGDREHALPAPPREPTGWRLGEPDLVLPMTEAFPLPADGEDVYRYFVLEPALAEDVVVTGMDFVPGDATVVHHMNAFVDTTGRARAKDAEDEEQGFSVFGTGSFFDYSGGSDGALAFGGWAPGVDPYRLPPDHGIHLPAGGDVVIEVHYHLTGRATEDRSRLGLYLAKEPVSHYLDGLVVGTMDIAIPPGEDDYARHVWMDVSADLRITDLMPHMHTLGSSMKAIATLPGGDVLPLVSVPRWDLRWQNIYVLAEPLTVPKGSRIDVWFHFDNSAENPANPFDPPRPIRWGWGTDEEMAELWIGFVPADLGASRRLHRSEMATWMGSARPTKPEPR